MKTKNQVKQDRSQAFARMLKEHNPGMTAQQLQERLGIKDERDDVSGGLATGRTLRRRLAGEAAPTLEALQHDASLAMELGLLPPLKQNGLRRPDLFGVADLKNMDKKYDEQVEKIKKVQNTRAAAEKALLAYAEALAALEDDTEIVTIDAPGYAPEEYSQEATRNRILSMAQEITANAEFRLW